jgi:Ca2+-binding RTX toxin-like protein
VVKHIVGTRDTIHINDSTAPLIPVPPCVRNGADGVTCDVDHVTFVSLDLGNENDKASQALVSADQSLPMKISGGFGDDTLTGGFQADIIDGGPGNDVIDGDDGDDVLTGGAGDDRIQGGRGKDTIDGQLGDDTLDGGLGDDVIHGSAGADSITGGKGSDKLFGDVGKDTLNSRDGETDALDCGIGKDTVDRDPADTLKHCS